jgi:hypothetical protein
MENLKVFPIKWILSKLQMDESSRQCSTLNCSIIQLKNEKLVIN